MQIYYRHNRFLFRGTVRELRMFLQNLPKEATLGDFIRSRLH
jgi:hypothetical protein